MDQPAFPAAATETTRDAAITFGPRVRKSPYFEATRRWGCRAYSVYNHMYLPLYYDDPVTDYWHLVEAVTLWDVAVQRQVEVIGRDAAAFIQLLTPRNLDRCAIGQCKYVPIVDDDGGMLNDPVLLRLGENHYWLSLADSDILLWAKAIAWRSGMEVKVLEPDVSPLQLQGPNAAAVMVALFGEWILDLRYFRCLETSLDGMPLVISRTGWSNELGYELYLRDGRFGDRLWERIMAAGRPFGIKPGAPSTIRRIEAGIFSYGSDITSDNNPFELGLDRFVDLGMEADFIGKQALSRIAERGVKRRIAGLVFDDGLEIQANEHPWPILGGAAGVGTVTSAVYSPRLNRAIALAIVAVEHNNIGGELRIATPRGEVGARICPLPFIEPPAELRAKMLHISTAAA